MLGDGTSSVVLTLLVSRFAASGAVLFFLLNASLGPLGPTLVVVGVRSVLFLALLNFRLGIWALSGVAESGVKSLGVALIPPGDAKKAAGFLSL